MTTSPSLFGRSVQNGVIKTTSASQIKTFKDCPRKWFFNKVLGLKEPEQEATVEGTRLHQQVEDYLLKGIPPEHASVKMAIQKGLIPRYVPEGPDRRYEVEVDIQKAYLAGVECRGRIDLRIPIKDGSFRIRDWKSTKNIASKNTTPEELARDIQGIIYLYDGFQVFPDAEYGIFDHVYLNRLKAGVKHVQTDPLDRPYVLQIYHEGIEPVVEEMKQIARVENPDDVPYELSACGKYGGCAFRDRCSAMKVKDPLEDSFFEALEQERINNQPTQVTKEEVVNIIEEMRKKKAARLAAQANTTPTPVVEKLIAKGVNPPDAAKPIELEQKVEQVQTAVESVEDVCAGVVTGQIDTSGPEEVSQKVVIEVPAPVVQEEKKRTRRTVAQCDEEIAALKAEVKRERERLNEALVENQKLRDTLSNPSEEVRLLNEAKNIQKPPVVEGPRLTLYIDCVPLVGDEDVLVLENEIKRRTPLIIDALRNVSPSDVPKNAIDVRQVAFGRGVAELCASFADPRGKVSGSVVASSRGGLSAQVLEVLIPQADLVVRGC